MDILYTPRLCTASYSSHLWLLIDWYPVQSSVSKSDLKANSVPHCINCPLVAPVGISKRHEIDQDSGYWWRSTNIGKQWSLRDRGWQSSNICASGISYSFPFTKTLHLDFCEGQRTTVKRYPESRIMPLVTSENRSRVTVTTSWLMMLANILMSSFWVFL